MTDHKLILLDRFRFKVAGKKCVVPNPLSGTMFDDDGYKTIFETGKDGTPIGFKQPPRVRDLGDGEIEFSVDTADADDLLPMIKKNLQRRGLPIASDEELLALVETREKSKALPIEFEPDLSEYQKPMMKIALELALAWLGAEYLHDDVAQKIKGFLFDERPVSVLEDEYKIRGNVRLFPPVDPHLGYSWDEVWQNNEHIHL